MIQKLKLGNVVKTGAVVGNYVTSDVLPFGAVQTEPHFKWIYSLNESDFVFGLGESVRGINKRGFKYVSWCSDVPTQNGLTPSLYGAHNMIVIYNAVESYCFSVFFDTGSRVTFDIGFTNQNVCTVESDECDIDVYVTTPENNSNNIILDVIFQFRKLIGQSYIPPKWAFGLQQSRWGYKTEQDVKTVVSRYRSANLPLDAVCLDIDYMDNYKDFTVDKEKFPNLKDFSSTLKTDGVHLIPIIDAGVKQEDGYDIYEEGISNEYFCKKENGKTFVAGVWPGHSCFTDFLNPKARNWFGKKYKFLTDLGIEGFWNDMNEPALFYTEEGLEDAFDKIHSYEGVNLDVNTYFEFKEIVNKIANNEEDYKRFFHQVEKSDGSIQKVRHDKVHNLYGANMTRSAFESLQELLPTKRTLLYSRSSYIGSHRYGGIWTGDNLSCWEHLKQEITMLPSLNMVGFLYSGADIGGFGDSTTRDLLLRWLALGVFTPLMRNHCAWNSRNQECYVFSGVEDFKSILDLRYALVPYIYSEFIKSCVNNLMYIRPVGFDYPNDERALHTEDELLVGESILIAPVYEQNADGRFVYLPENMTKVCWCKGKITTEQKEKGSYYIRVPLDSVVFFVKQNHIVPLCKPAKDTASLDTSTFTVVGNGSSYFLYEDDGYTTNIDLQKNLREIKNV